MLRSSASVQQALKQYKLGVATSLADTIRAQEARSEFDNEQDDELLRLLPKPTPPLSDLKQGQVDGGLIPDIRFGLSRKGAFADMSSNPVQVSSPLQASIAAMQDLVEHCCVSKKQALLTRENLSAGIIDPTGLLGGVIQQCSGTGQEEGDTKECRFCVGE